MKRIPPKSTNVIKVADLVPGGGVYQVGEFEELLAESAALHGHICPGQALDIRIALRGCQELGIEKPKA